MTRSADGGQGDRSGNGQARTTGSSPASEGQEAAVRAPQVLVVDADRALLALLKEWLAEYGFSVVEPGAADKGTRQRFDLVVVDVPFPRQGGPDLLRRVANDHPGTPILALSSSFFPGIESTGAVAQALGVASVLPKPIMRDALMMAVCNLLRAET